MSMREKRLEVSKSIAKCNKKNEGEKNNILHKASNSKAKFEDDEYGTSENSSKDEYIRLFVRRYNKYMSENGLKHYNRNLMNFRKSNPPKKWYGKNKEEKN